MAVTTAKRLRSGTREWIFQRIANLMVVAYGCIFIGQILAMDRVDFASWQTLFTQGWFQIYSSLTLAVLCLNSILAGWQIGADYVKPVLANKAYMTVCVIGSLAYLGLGLACFWSV